MYATLLILFAGLELNDLLFDHRPLELNDDDYQRVCQIPKRKVFFNIYLFIFNQITVTSLCHLFNDKFLFDQGGNFRDLPGVRVRPDKKVEWDPEVPRQYLSSGKPLVFWILSTYLYINLLIYSHCSYYFDLLVL